MVVAMYLEENGDKIVTKLSLRQSEPAPSTPSESPKRYDPDGERKACGRIVGRMMRPGLNLEPRDEVIRVRLFRGDPPLKHHPARTRHGEQVAIPGWRSGVGGQGAVWAVIVDEVFKVGEERHARLLEGHDRHAGGDLDRPAKSSTPRTMCPRVVT